MRLEDVLKAIKPYVLGWVTGVSGAGVTSVTGTSPIVSSGGTTPAISITAASTSGPGSLLQATAPTAGMYNYVGITNGETGYTNKPLFDATVPTTIGVSDAAAAGTAAVSARRDHQHASPASFTATAHNLFSAIHGDTTGAANPVDGDVIIGNVTPKWSKLAISVPAAGLVNFFGVLNGELRPSWKALFDATVPTTIAPSDAAAAGSAVVSARRDHKHAAPATFPATAHDIFSATHGDTSGAASPVDGDVIIGNRASIRSAPTRSA